MFFQIALEFLFGEQAVEGGEESVRGEVLGQSEGGEQGGAVLRGVGRAAEGVGVEVELGDKGMFLFQI